MPGRLPKKIPAISSGSAPVVGANRYGYILDGRLRDIQLPQVRYAAAVAVANTSPSVPADKPSRPYVSKMMGATWSVQRIRNARFLARTIVSPFAGINA